MDPLPATTPPLPAVLAATVALMPCEPTVRSPVRVDSVSSPVPTDVLVVTLLDASATATPIPMKPTPTPVASDCVCESLAEETVTSPSGSDTLLPSEADTLPVVEERATAPCAPRRMPPPPATALA